MEFKHCAAQVLILNCPNWSLYPGLPSPALHEGLCFCVIAALGGLPRHSPSELCGVHLSLLQYGLATRFVLLLVSRNSRILLLFHPPFPHTLFERILCARHHVTCQGQIRGSPTSTEGSAFLALQPDHDAVTGRQEGLVVPAEQGGKWKRQKCARQSFFHSKVDFENNCENYF